MVVTCRCRLLCRADPLRLPGVLLSLHLESLLLVERKNQQRVAKCNIATGLNQSITGTLQVMMAVSLCAHVLCRNAD